MPNVLSIDVEEPWQGEFTRKLPRVQHTFTSPRNIYPVLDLLDEFKTKATFFIVSQVLRDEDLKAIADRGHEIGFHTFDHLPLWEKNYDSLSRELSTWGARVERLTGRPCIGFRAPSFSLNKKTAWALQALRANSYLYDSSVFPVRGKLYGLPDAPLTPYQPDLIDPGKQGNSGLMEFPSTVKRLFGYNIPIAGGFYLRAIPLWILTRFLDSVQKSGRDLFIYTHNWELDQNLERMHGLPFSSRLYCYHHVRRTRDNLKVLLERYRFGRFTDLLPRFEVQQLNTV